MIVQNCLMEEPLVLVKLTILVIKKRFIVVSVREDTLSNMPGIPFS